MTLTLRWTELWDTPEAPATFLDGDTPLDAGRIRQQVLRRARPRRPRRALQMPRMPRLRGLRAALLAALLTAVLLLGAAGTVEVLGASLPFLDWFGPLTQGQREALDAIGQPFPQGGVTSGGVTVTPAAALADERVYYLRLQLQAPEGMSFPEPDRRIWEDVRLEMPEGAYQRPGWSLTTEVLDSSHPAAGRLELVLRFESQDDGDLVFNDGVSKLLHIEDLWVSDPDGGGVRLLEGTWTLDIGRHFESSTRRIPIRPMTRRDGDMGEVTLYGLSISPLSLSFRWKYQEYRGTLSPGLAVVLRDRTEVPTVPHVVLHDAEPGKKYDHYLVFAEPVELDQVDHIRFGDQEIPVPWG